MKNLLFFYIFIFFSVSSFSQSNLYRLKNITTANGLSQSSVIAIYQDFPGQMWFATRDGLNKYDGSSIKVFRNDPKDTLSICNNDILSIEGDKSGNIWVGTYNGLNCYNPSTNIFKHYFHGNGKNTLTNNTIWDIKEIKNEIWIATAGGISIFNKTTQKFTTVSHNSKNNTSLPNNFVLNIFQTKKGVIWVGTSKGLCQLVNRKGNSFEFKQYYTANNESVYVQDIKEDKSGNLWVATKANGLLKLNTILNKLLPFSINQNQMDADVRSLDFDKKGVAWVGSYNGISTIQTNGFISKVYNSPEKKTSFGKIKTVFTDKKGSVWIGSYYNGISFWDESNNNFNNLNQNSGLNALSYDVVSSLAADANKNIYIGTEGGGITVFDSKTATTTKINSLSSIGVSVDNIKSLCLSNTGILWIGTFTEGLAAYDIHSKRFVNENIAPDLKNILKESGVYVITKGRKNGIFWLGTFGKGLIRYDSTNKTYQIIGNDNYSDNFLTNNRVRTLLIDKNENLWIGTQSGLNVINLNDFDNKVYHIKHYFFDNKLLSGDDILSIFQDKKGKIWIGTKAKGLYEFNGTNFNKINIKKEDSDVTAIHSISQDDNNNLWISSNYGIIKYNLLNKSSFIYDQKDGLISNEFNDNAFLQIGYNKFYYGGPSGITYFDTKKLPINKYTPQVILTDFKIANKSINVANDNEILEKSIAFTNSLTLSYDKANFTITFAIPNFINPTNNKYKYRLVGLDNQWITTSNTEATFTIQNSGTYVFEVKGANNDGVWNAEPTTLEIVVQPAPWKSWWALSLFTILLCVSLYGLIWIIKSKEKLRQDLFLEYRESERNKEDNSAKLQFFTNISHEFRTPLTLILGPLQQILLNYNGPNAMYKKLLVIESSANHLLKLINRLMDFRKFENNQFILETAEGNIVKYIKEIFLSFTEFAKDGDYKYTFESSDEEILVYFDRFKLERVFYNLISNAFRYTPKGGEIIVKIRNEVGQVIIEVEDTGIGIAKEHVDKIFDLFFEIPAHNNEQINYNKGTGIGLSIVKNIINLHKGTITVENKTTKGVVFKVKMLLGRNHLLDKEILKDFKISDDLEQYTSQLNPAEIVQEDDINDLENTEDKLTVLIVEDHKVLRSFMKNLLKEEYNVITAENGAIGLKKALKFLPDLIVSDVIMPEMVGTELCSKIKENIKTSHIPVILLTSRSSLIYKIEGLESGADDYISKPFNLVEFKLRIKNLLISKQRLKTKFSSEDSFTPSEIVVSSLDEQLLKKAFKIVEENIANEQFDIPFFCSELGVSRTMLFTKIKAWTNFTPNEFIHEIRMKRAAQLLEQNKINISQISYKVGFNNPKYFSKCFQKKFGETPTQYLSKFSDDSKS
ncbi:two-component regulator propeller domain-containing protein [Flavobacterium sp.]|jgi:signal transduction histidine kinase/ligand-binding sensor domain-containing protein/DNA-binding response OmpR family regulator|uniref:two-component regulator propeller domain-containing protein n=1 Tax=Flavobacterium sp. TaxID=239 RepID=UPI0037BF4511